MANKNKDKDTRVDESAPGKNSSADKISSPPDPFDLEAMRAGTGDGIQETDEIKEIRCGRPNKDVPIRVHPDLENVYDGYLLEKDNMHADGPYLVAPNIAYHPNIIRHVRRRILVVAITSHKEVFLIPVHHPDDAAAKQWGRSFRKAIMEIGRQWWIRIESDLTINRYRALSLPEDCTPGDIDWPDIDIGEMVKACFGERFITSFDHELIKPLLGDEII